MATKKDSKKKATDKKVDEAKLAKRKARQEALKSRPAVQRPNGKQIDVIATENGGCVKNYGYPIKSYGVHVGVIITSVAFDADGKILNTSVSFVPGNLTVKSKKGHGTILAPKNVKDGSEEEKDDSETNNED